jgi:putative ABC transport system permease protein
MKFLLLIFKNLFRNKVRTILTFLATMVLVFVVTMIWNVVYFLDDLTKQKTENLQAIITEKWQIPSQMPMSYARPLSDGAASKPGDIRPKDFMLWQFYGGTIDPEKKTRDSMMFLVATDPQKLLERRTRDGEKLPPMIDDLKDIDRHTVEKLAAKKNGALVGPKRLKTINKKVGERIKITGLDWKGIDLEFEIVGELPAGQWEDLAVMNEDYLNDAVDSYRGPGGTRHPLIDKRLNFVWLRVGNPEDFTKIGQQIESSPQFRDPAVKCETFGSMVASFLDAYTGFIWFIKWILVPGSMVSMILVIANAISLSVRERRKEIAVLKVLGFGPGIIMFLVLGEAILLGGGSGILTGGLTFEVFNNLMGGIRVFPGNPPYPVPLDALWWGPVVGGGAALLGSLMPAWSARSVKVSEVFAKIA